MSHVRPTLKSLSALFVGFVLLCGSLSLTSPAAEVTEARIREQVATHVQDSIRTLIPETDRQHVNVQIVKVPAAPFQFPQVKNAADIKITTESTFGDTYSERGIVRVHLESPDGASRDIGVPVQIVIKKPVWVVKNSIRANEPLHASDFSLETRDVSHSYSYTTGTERNLNDYVARVNLRPGDILDTRKIVIPPDVTCNNEVKIRISIENGMTITVPGIALSDGRIGETIRVRQTVYLHKSYNAKVIDKNQVLVEI